MTIDEALAELDATAAARLRAGLEYREASLRCRRLVVALLEMGVQRKDLINRPFSSRALTTIQQQAGLTRHKR